MPGKGSQAMGRKLFQERRIANGNIPGALGWDRAPLFPDEQVLAGLEQSYLVQPSWLPERTERGDAIFFSI